MGDQGDFLEVIRPGLISAVVARPGWVLLEVQDTPGCSHGWCELRHGGVMCFWAAREGHEQKPGWRGR